MNKHLVGIAEMKVSENNEDLLIAPNLGSCLAVAVYDPNFQIGGLVHCLLPLSSSDTQRARDRPCMFVDTGVALLLNTFLQRGSNKRDLLVVAAGGASINDQQDVFEIGKKNYTILRKILWKNNILIRAEHIGENSSRTLSLDISSGSISLKFKGETLQLI